MILTQIFTDEIAASLILATGPFGSGAPDFTVFLVEEPFTPSPALQALDLTTAVFEGSSPITSSVGPQLLIRDPLTQRWGVMLKAPGGGFKWIVGGPSDLPKTIYGYGILIDTDLVSSSLLPAPVILAQVGDFVEISAVFAFLPYQAMTDLDA